jgi:DNA processing protein
MAGGLDRLYPSGNRELFNDIAARGLLLSELPPGAEPTKWRFLQRNRLIAALGDATLLVEAHARSGAVSTANRAVDLGRPVGAVPGAITSPGSDGCHQLIRDFKAQLITCSGDILELIGEGEVSLTNTVEGLGALETRVLDVIGARIADISRICGEGGLTRSEAEVGIASLSLLGLIDRDSSGWRRKL